MGCDRRIAVAVALLAMAAPLLPAQDPAAEQERAIAAIRALGGKVDMSTRSAGGSHRYGQPGCE